jgi:type IV secretory pathway VirB2 component (pilin)
MAVRADQQRIVGRALVASAAVMFALGAAFWNGFLELHESVRPPVTMALAIVGVLDLGIGLFFLRRAKEGESR